jgi:hypothetical protein
MKTGKERKESRKGLQTDQTAQPFHLMSREARATAGLEGGSLADEG